MDEWLKAQRKQIRKMDDSTLEKEIAFAIGFAPATTALEQSWFEELNLERGRRARARYDDEVAAMRER